MNHQGTQREHNAIFQEGIGAFIKRHLKESGLDGRGLQFQPVPGDGSKRVFWRILVPRAEMTLIAMENAPVDDFSKRENIAYLMIGKHLHKKGIPVPRLYSSNLDRGWFIMEDMGKTNLQTRSSQETVGILLYERVVEILLRLQVEGVGGFDTTWTCQTEKYDRLVMRRYESDYFRDAFLINYLHIQRDWSELDRAFDHLAEVAAEAEGRFLLHRDFQSRNILISESEAGIPEPRIGIIDWQGARLGPLGYDLASLVIDPYTNLPLPERARVYGAYLALLKKSWPGQTTPFERFYPYLAIQRNLQILGAFAFLSKVRGKTYFEAYIPGAIKSLASLLDDVKDRKLKNLRDVLRNLPLPAD